MVDFIEIARHGDDFVYKESLERRARALPEGTAQSITRVFNQQTLEGKGPSRRGRRAVVMVR